jgi:hypothetical protein
VPACSRGVTTKKNRSKALPSGRTIDIKEQETSHTPAVLAIGEAENTDYTSLLCLGDPEFFRRLRVRHAFEIILVPDVYQIQSSANASGARIGRGGVLWRCFENISRHLAPNSSWKNSRQEHILSSYTGLRNTFSGYNPRQNMNEDMGRKARKHTSAHALVATEERHC